MLMYEFYCVFIYAYMYVFLLFLVRFSNWTEIVYELNIRTFDL
jgi:hypothetical protein